MLIFFLLLSLANISNLIYCKPIPIEFAIPEIKIVTSLPDKDKDFASLIPGNIDTYVYDSEEVYYRDYQRSYFAITTKKGGWDCLRHYEILAQGCIPYFVDLDKCDSNTMCFLPRELIQEAMHLDGVSYLSIDHNRFDQHKYFEILEKLLDYTRQHLTTRKMAEYFLSKINYSGGSILFVSSSIDPDYMRCLTLIGLKEILGNKVVDFPKIPHIYNTFKNAHNVYGKGFSYTRILDDSPIDRNNIEQRIRNKEFELIVFGSIHHEKRGRIPFYDLIHQLYPKENIAYICGEDAHRCQYAHFNNFFLREFN